MTPLEPLSLILVVPAYNEEGCIEQVISEWDQTLSEFLDAETYLILVVNDGSRDRTGEILDAIDSRLSTVKVIHQVNGGHGAAVLHGYREALSLLQNPSDSQWIGQVDSDNQFVPGDFLSLWQKRNSSRFVLGWRKERDDPFIRKIVSAIMKSLLLVLGGSWIKDPNIPFRIIRSDYLEKLMQRVPPTAFAPNVFLSFMAVSDGVDLCYMPVTHRERETGVVSIKRLKLLKVCIRSAIELLTWRLGISQSGVQGE